MIVDLHHDVGGDVLGGGNAVVGDHHALELLAHLVGARPRVHIAANDRPEGGVLEQVRRRRERPLVEQLRIAEDELRDRVPVVVPGHRRERKNARMSSTRSSGSSMAAK